MDISIIVPSYNAMGKLERCLTSLRNQTMAVERYEVIFVDDCSTDGTFAFLQQQADIEPNWRVLQLPSNSGSPSKPRNVGTQHALGEYIFYLDCDDEILPDTLELHFAHAKATNACIVRGYLLSDDGTQQQEMNRLTHWDPSADLICRIATIISLQSTTVPSLIKKAVLQQHQIEWPEDIRVGEDSIFLSSLIVCCQRVEYFDHPTFIYNRRASFQASSTQEYGSRELNNHLRVWQQLIVALEKIGLNYTEIRLRVGLQTAIRGLIYQNKGDVTHADFQRLAEFVNRYSTEIFSKTFAANIAEVLQTIKANDFHAFQQSCKPKLLIAGHDLKFIQPMIPALGEFYQISIDEWKGHDAHDIAHSEAMLAQADYIWCEWLLGNAVWYAKRKKPHQKLVIRMHRFELGRDFGEKLNVENVDAIVAVSVLFFERLLERFPNIPRQKVKLLPNYVDLGGYEQVSPVESRFTLAMIGIVPYRKGFHHAIELLHGLKQYDSRYRLKIFGKGPQDLPWLHKHHDEMTYYADCEQRIQTYSLQDSIEFLGHCDIKKALAAHQVGFVLSLSEDTPGFPGPESFHLAIADGFAAGAKSMILRWAGAEYVYLPEHIFDTLDDIREEIVRSKTDEKSSKYTESGKFLMEKYRVNNFVLNFRELL